MFLLAAAAQAKSTGEPDPLFQNLDILEVRIVAPLSTILSERSDETELDGTFHYTNEAGEVTEVDIGLRTRGRFRRDKKVCPFPPLRLNFRKSQTKESLLHKQDKIKLVTHCRDRSNAYEQTVLREYAVYRILNQLTDVSFRVRLLRVTYVDTEKDNFERVRYGFFIEHEDRLAKRLGISVLELQQTKVSKLQPAYTNLISVFHFLIGNTDFSPIAGADEVCCHNHVLFAKEGELTLSVPYDFDQSGLVDAPHGVVNSRFKLRNAQQRLYRGRCVNNQHLDATIATFKEKREAIFAVIGEREGVEARTAREMTKFVERFYKVIDSPKQVKRQLVKKCIGELPSNR